MWSCLLNTTVLRFVLGLHSEPGNEAHRHFLPLKLFAISLREMSFDLHMICHEDIIRCRRGSSH